MPSEGAVVLVVFPFGNGGESGGGRRGAEPGGKQPAGGRSQRNFRRIWYQTLPPWAEAETPSLTKPKRP